MPGITAFTDEEVMEVTAGTRLFKFIAEQNFAGIEGMLSKSNVGLEHLDEISNTPFLYACYLGRYPFVKYLHKRGADIMRINVFGQNALAMAAYSGDQKTCNYLLGLIPFETFNRSSICSALCVAVITENIGFVKFFMQLEYFGNATKFHCQSGSIHGVCPLKLAMLHKHKQIIEILCPMHKHHVNASQISSELDEQNQKFTMVAPSVLR